jgi:hypothetical protein
MHNQFKMNTAEKLVAETWYDAYCLGEFFDTPEDELNRLKGATKENIQENMTRLMHDYSEYYDVDWFPIIATRGIFNQLDWTLIETLAQEHLVDVLIADLFDVYDE